MTELTGFQKEPKEYHKQAVHSVLGEIIGSSPNAVRAIWILDKGWTDSPKARAEMEARTAFSCLLALSVEELTGNTVPIIAVGGELKGQEKSGAQTVKDIAIDIFHIPAEQVIVDPISNQTSVEAGVAKTKAIYSRAINAMVKSDQDLLVGVTYSYHQQRAQQIAERNKTDQSVRVISWAPQLYTSLKTYIQNVEGYKLDWERIDSMIASAMLSKKEEEAEKRYEELNGTIIGKIPRIVANALVTYKRGTPQRLRNIRGIVRR